MNSAYTGTIRLGVYAYAASESQPGARLLDAGSIVNPAALWNTISSLSLAVTLNTQYWLVYMPSTNTPDYTNHDTLSTGPNSYYFPKSGGWGDGTLPTPCPTCTGGEGGAVCIRAGVTAAGGATNVVYMII
jgi:hypothetical protein